MNNGVKEPPKNIPSIIRNIGPGLILAGSIVGSGELIATTKTGAEAHFDFLWLIILGCVVKVFAQIEFGRHVITHNRTSLSSLNSLPGPRLKLSIMNRKIQANWILLFWSGMLLTILAQQGGIAGGVGQAMAITFPLSEEGSQRNKLVAEKVKISLEMSEAKKSGNVSQAKLLRQQLDDFPELPKSKDDVFWAMILASLTIGLLLNGKFSFIEKFCIFLVSSFTLVTIINLIALQTHDAWAVRPEDVLAGLSFSFPSISAEKNPLITALATFGIIGVGASELLVYPYWCMEKGYARFTGAKESGEPWLARAKGWLRVMQWDAWGAMFVYTFCTIAFYLLGASVLGRSGLVPEGSEMIQTLSSMYAPVFGEWARSIFLLGAIAVLFSTFFVALAGQGRMAIDALVVSGIVQKNAKTRTLGLRITAVLFPILSVSCYVFFPKPVVLILISGTMQALMLPLIGFAVLYFRYRESDSRLGHSPYWDFFLWLSFLSFLAIGCYQAYAHIFN